jgi:tRNA(adenine34) deaminase
MSDQRREADTVWMTLALREAEAAALRGEVPVGALIVADGAVVASTGNLKELAMNPLGHAEIRVIEEAARRLGRWRLTGCTLYVTLEPCVMCAGAIVHSRLDRVVYGATDKKAGAVESLYQILSDTRLNHRPTVTGGVEAEACGKILSDFFASRRKPNDRE